MNKLFSWFKNYIIPHKKNSYNPSFFSGESFSAILVVILIIELVYIVQVFVVYKKPDFLAAVLPSVLTNLTNEDRLRNNALPLSINPLLTEAARMKALDMAQKGYFSHIDPSGNPPWFWLDQAGYKYSYAGENLAINFIDSKDVQTAWLNSPTHKENILKQEFKEIGIGVAEGKYQGRDVTFVVEFFGTQAQAKKEPIGKVLGEQIVMTPEVKTYGVQLIKSSIEEISASPVSTNRNIMYMLVGIFSVVFILAVFIKIKIQHTRVLAGGLALIVITLFLISFNKSFSRIVEIPTDTSSASVFQSISN